MKETVIVIGSDGYLGFPLTLRLLRKEYRVIGIDNLSRRKAVKEMQSFSAIPIDSPDKRIERLKEFGSFIFEDKDIHLKYNFLKKYIETYKPKAIVNLAQQPSGPYSHKSRQHAVFTTINNVIGTLNVLYAIKDSGVNTHVINIGSMGEYDHSMGTTIEEGTFDFIHKGKLSQNVIFPRRPGSFYHASKTASTYHIDGACRWWGLKATDIMQGVVYGNWTEEIENMNTNTRLDSDECFGTVVNRFVTQAVLGQPLTIYGEGEHSRGFLALNDSIQCLMLAIENDPSMGEYRTWNQLDETFTMKKIAEKVCSVAKTEFALPTEIVHIESPRIEKTEHFPYNVVTEKLKEIGFKPTRSIEEEVRYMINKLIKRDDLFPLIDVVMPKIKWK